MKYFLSIYTIVFVLNSQAQDYGLFASNSFNSEQFETIKRATVAIVANENLKSTDLFTLGENYKFCSTQKFEDEKLWSNCTGVLISKNIVLTAGHCLQDTKCPDKSFVFDYRNNNDISRIQTDIKNIYKCKSVLYSSKPILQKQLRDFALIQLDRDVTGREPIALSTSQLTRAEDIFAVGHPLGLPLKLSVGFVAEKDLNKNKVTKTSFYSAQMISHPGISGSGVYNSNNELIGLLVRGEANIEKDDRCQNIKSCDKQSCPWIEIQKLDLKVIRKYMN